MSQVAYKDAQNMLNELMNQAEQGEEVIIEREDGQRFKLTVVSKSKRRPLFGCAKGEVEILEGFDDAVEGFEEYL